MLPPIIQIGDVLLSSDILTEKFCCDLAACKGQCCVEGDAGAPVTMEEISEIEDRVDEVWNELSASAQAVIDRQGVAYTDEEGDLVTSIVHGKDCVFTCYGSLTPTLSSKETGSAKDEEQVCLCALEKIARKKAPANSQFVKPISCALYPIRAKQFSNGTIGLNYHRWAICEPARRKGHELNLPVYVFLKEPLIRRFGEEWYQELCDVAKQIREE